jgi:hypothetical protein
VESGGKISLFPRCLAFADPLVLIAFAFCMLAIVRNLFTPLSILSLLMLVIASQELLPPPNLLLLTHLFLVSVRFLLLC